jgi:hypothetical protein
MHRAVVAGLNREEIDHVEDAARTNITLDGKTAS